MPSLGANKTVLNTTPAPSTPPNNFHQGCCGISLNPAHKSVLNSAIINNKMVPTAKEMKVAISSLPPTALANCVLMADCEANAVLLATNAVFSSLSIHFGLDGLLPRPHLCLIHPSRLPRVNRVSWIG